MTLIPKVGQMHALIFLRGEDSKPTATYSPITWLQSCYQGD